MSQGSILRDGSVAKRRPPVNLKPEDASLFSADMERAIPPTRLLELRGVWASADGVLFKGGKILVESFAFPANRARWKRRSALKLLATNYLLRRRRVLRRPAAWIVDDWSSGYFHWLADALTRLYAIRHLLDGLVVLLPHRYATLEFVRSSLEAFGVREVEYLRPDEVVRCERLLVPTPTAPSGHYNEAVIRSARDVLVGAYRPAAGGKGERIYVSRGKARRRRIVNEGAVIDVLRAFRFEVVHAEEHSLAEQVRIASAADCLVSNHGAGLTNMLFMRAGGRVLELRHRADGVNNCYFALASALDLDFFYQRCDPEIPGEDAHMANLRVDVRALGETLDLMLGGRFP